MNTRSAVSSRIKHVFGLAGYIRGYGLWLGASIIVHLIYKVAPIAIGFFTSLMVSHALLHRFEAASKLFWLNIVLVAANAVLHYLDVLISHDMAYRILADMRNVLYRKIDEIAPAATEDRQSGDLLSVVLEDVELLEWFYAHTINQIVVAFFVPLCSLIFLGVFHWSIPLCLTLSILLLIMIPMVKSRQSNEQGSMVREKLGQLNARVVDGIQGIKDIISFRWQARYFQKFFSSAKDYNEASLAYQRRAATEGGSVLLVIGLGSLAANILLISLVTAGRIDVQWLLPLFSTISLIFAPLLEALNMSTNYGSIFAAAERVSNMLRIKPYTVNSGILDAGVVYACAKAAVPKHAIRVDFDRVSFRYPTRRKGLTNPDVLLDISLSFSTGETVALVGASGSGKSTCARLLQRFWDPDSGRITLNGIDIREIKVEELRDIVTVVPQDNYLFNLSVRENLLLAKPNATDEEIVNACAAAQADLFIRKLPGGMNTVIGERGLRLSGGEKQRLAIAQAFLKNSPVLVLDEASANLDFENERLIGRAVDSLKSGRATLVIAHRISTIKKADRVVFIDSGRTVATGVFDELTRESLLFKRLIGESHE